jgi:hypothetical protein
MGRPNQAARTKRDRERQRQERQQEKRAEKAKTRDEKSSREAPADGVDPDIAGIVPGPQPIPEED